MSAHPGDELLSEYALDPSLVEMRGELEDHLDVCESCRRRLATLQAIEQLLTERESWPDPDRATGPRPSQAISAMAARNRYEDAEAEAMLTPLLDKFLADAPGAFVWKDIASKPEFHTAGVVRKLADAADKAQYSVPLRALHLAETASAIVGMLSTETYTDVEIAALRGLSWKQQANANRHLGRFNAALEALNRAERAFRELRRPELDLASIMFIRATINLYQGKYDVAKRYADESTATFSRLGQTDLYLRSRHLQGCILFEEREIAQAQLIFQSIYEYGQATGDLLRIGNELHLLGLCYLELGEFARAAKSFHDGLAAFRQLGMASWELHCRWGLALVLQREGRYRAAIARLRDVREDFVALEEMYAAALVALDLMESLLLLGKPREVQRTAGDIVTLFKDAGMITGAITAAQYLKQAAAMRNVTPPLVDYVRKYFRRVELQPDFAFMPPSGL